MRLLLALAATTMLLASCTGGVLGEGGVGTLPPDTPTTARPTTTQPETTTTEESEFDRLRRQLVEVHTDYIVNASRVDTTEPDGWDDFLGWYKQNSRDPALASTLEFFQEDLDANRDLIGPTGISNITDIAWNGVSTPEEAAEETIWVSDCTINLIAGVDVDGTVLFPAGTIFVTVTLGYQYDLDEQRFYLTYIEGDQPPCDPINLLLNGNGPVTSDAEAKAALKVHEEYLTVALDGIDQRVEGYQSTYDAIDRLATDPQGPYLLEVTKEDEESGYASDGAGYEFKIVGIQVGENSAAIVDCSRYAATIYDQNGTVAFIPHDYWEVREAFLLKEDGQWKIHYYWQGGDQECDPRDY